MSDDDDTKTQASAPVQQFNINRLYIKDLSFESPAAPELFATIEEWNPHINLQINTETRAVGDNIYEE